MNLPNKLTIGRIIMAILIIFILLFPFDSIGLKLNLYVNESLVINMKYILSGIIFMLASITDFLDGYIARKYDLITDFGKMMDAIADKILVNSVLIILSAQGAIHPIIPVVVIMRDTFVNSIKMAAGNKGNVVAAIMSGKIKTACLMVGIVLTLFYNMPFVFINLRVSDFLLVVAATLSITSGYSYYKNNRIYIFSDKNDVKLES
ncbi:MAG TPA: CDP-diacylglycerol--glycerol-3-phosphate 3-phosphatidyltransferase [Tenericutes bacterium]|nr:CDP-diacylglycerol--glycerol-3-phosphate 3-phosphatidyltransferase [Mycoplasmatota bacterium]